MKSVALFGGSFDPPHIGHEAIVNELSKLQFIDEIVVMPTYLNPFKHISFAPSSLRLEWIIKMCRSIPKVRVSDFEVKTERKVPTIESVKFLLKSYEKVFVVIGADNLSTLGMWKNYEELSSLCEFIVVTRAGNITPKGMITIKLDVAISSTVLRSNIQPSLLPSSCRDEILDFYKDKNANKS